MPFYMCSVPLCVYASGEEAPVSGESTIIDRPNTRGLWIISMESCWDKHSHDLRNFLKKYPSWEICGIVIPHQNLISKLDASNLHASLNLESSLQAADWLCILISVAFGTKISQVVLDSRTKLIHAENYSTCTDIDLQWPSAITLNLHVLRDIKRNWRLLYFQDITDWLLVYCS